MPHADDVSYNKTEGSGVGVLKEPFVSAKGLKQQPFEERNCSFGDGKAQEVKSLCFTIDLDASMQVTWETFLVGKKLYVEISPGILPDGSKESLVTLLEYAEDVLKCSHVFVCFKKARADRASLIRTFMFLGFSLVAPGNEHVPAIGDVIFMGLAIEEDPESEDESSDSQSDEG